MGELQIQTTQNPHTQATTKPSTNLHGFGDIKTLVQDEVLYKYFEDEIEHTKHIRVKKDLIVVIFLVSVVFL